MTVAADPIQKALHAPGEPSCKVLVGDCQDVMPLMRAGSFDCIFADPPFNIGEDYSEWKDKLPWQDYLVWTERWVNKCVTLLSPRGNLWINCPDAIAARIVVHLEDTHRMTLADWCIWHYRFGQWKASGFIRSKVHALHFVHDRKTAIWNPAEVMVDSDRASIYNDQRTQDTDNPGKRVPFDVWGIPSDGKYWGRVQGNNKERNPNHENQLPEKYLERVIRSTSNPDSVFFTPFVGSGTELVVARSLGRVSIGIEIGESEADSAMERITRGSVRITKG